MILHKRIFTFVIASLFCLSLYSQQKITSANAREIADKWVNKGVNKGQVRKKIKSIKQEKQLYCVEYEDNSSVLISKKTGVHPIIGYSKSRSLSYENLTEGEQKWLEVVNEYIESYETDSSAITGETTYLESGTVTNFDAETEGVDGVPSLFEATQSSRWGTWDISEELPYENDDMTCVPLAMAQIVKYYRFPTQGQGISTDVWPDPPTQTAITKTSVVDNSKQWYDYANMPFRLHYCAGCGGGDNSWDVMPGVANEQLSEVSRLVFNCGVAVGMWWNGGGTHGNTGNWVYALEKYFNYSPNWVYYDRNTINNNPEGFKADLRTELQNGRPVLFASFRAGGGGHAVVIDGYENEDYFHMAYGLGGALDTYYYLFTPDNDGTHTALNRINYNATMGIRPNCPSDVNVFENGIIISETDNIVYQALNTVNLTNVKIAGNGTTGGRVTISAKEVNLNAGFEVQKGATMFIQPINCNQ